MGARIRTHAMQYFPDHDDKCLHSLGFYYMYCVGKRNNLIGQCGHGFLIRFCSTRTLIHFSSINVSFADNLMQIVDCGHSNCMISV